MDDSETYMNVKFTKTVSPSPFRGQDKQEPKQNIGNRSCRKICLLCLVTFALVAVVAGLSIYVSQTRRSLITSEQNYQRLWEEHQEKNRTQRQCQQRVHDLNSTLESRIPENSRLELSQRTCRKNLSALNNKVSNLENNISVLNYNLSELNKTHTDLRHQFKQLEMKERITTERQAQLCQYLTRRRVQTCPQNWMENEDRCYFISNLEKSYDGASEHCSNFNSRPLEINSSEEDEFLSISIGDVYRTYWIGKCRDGNVASYLLYKMYYGSPTCSKCDSYSYNDNCKRKHRFICEKRAHLYPDIPEDIRGLCQQPLGPTSVNSTASFIEQGDQNRTPPSKRGLTDAFYNFQITSTRCKM